MLAQLWYFNRNALFSRHFYVKLIAFYAITKCMKLFHLFTFLFFTIFNWHWSVLNSMTAPAEFETLLCHVRIVKKRAERQISDSSLVDIRDQFFPLLTWKWRENTSDVKSVDDLRGGDRSGTWKWLYRLLRTPWPFLLAPSYFFCACQYDHVYYCQISNLALFTDGLIPHGWAMSTYKRLH